MPVMETIKMLNEQMDKVVYDLLETIENKKKLNDVLVYGNYSYNMGKYYGLLKAMEKIDMDSMIERHEQDKAMITSCFDWNDKLYRKLKGE